MKIYLDDCAYSKRLKRQLEAAGHQVQTPFDAGLSGQPDDVHLGYAAEHGWALLTYNADDFITLHEQSSAHAGLLIVCQDADMTKNMRYADIVQVVQNLAASDVPIAGQLYVLNYWKW
ncbi:MAG TPA: hypothetical protein ENN99_03690 [Chloroflexi bacterium]|nr:hypothetical protein [Chloroflexota bacterium]